MSGTVTPFTPSLGMPQRFSATLLGPTVNVTSTSTAFTITVQWNVYGQRFYVLIQDASGNTVLNRPLVASPPGYDINLVAGYFSGSSLVFEEATGSFVVTTYPVAPIQTVAQPAYVVPGPSSPPTSDSGYILYAYWPNPGPNPIVYLSATFTVPPQPASSGDQVIYLFPGIEPQSGVGTAFIVQPVLQWTESLGGWTIQSYYVTGGVSTVSGVVSVTPGTVLTGVIAYTGVNTYQISFVGYSGTVLNVTTPQAATVALMALECYDLTTCSSYPSGITVFSNIQVNTGTPGTSGSPASGLAWIPVTEFSDCGLSIAINSESQITLTH